MIKKISLLLLCSCSPVNLSRRQELPRNTSLLDGSQRSTHELVPDYKISEPSHVMWWLSLLHQEKKEVLSLVYVRNLKLSDTRSGVLYYLIKSINLSVQWPINLKWLALL